MNIRLPEQNCTGCSACMQTCKVGAISMKPQKNGPPDVLIFSRSPAVV